MKQVYVQLKHVNIAQNLEMTFISERICKTCQLFSVSCWTFVFMVSTGQEVISFVQAVAVWDVQTVVS